MRTPCGRRNDIKLWTVLDDEPVSHFRLYEFENVDGLAMIHPSVLDSLELTRRDLCTEAHEEVYIIVTDAVRTQQDLDRLAARFGWTSEGGTVSPLSKHLIRFGGIAVDILARTAAHSVPIPQKVLGPISARYFDWVKHDYLDGHVHADNRNCHQVPPTTTGH